MSYVLVLSPAIEGDVAAVAEHYGEIVPEVAERFAADRTTRNPPHVGELRVVFAGR